LLLEDQRLTQTRIGALSATLASHAQLLTREAAEKAEMQATMQALTGSLQERAAASARLRTHIAATRGQIEAKRAAQRAYADRVDAQSRLNAPELAFWERYLGCRIEGSGRDDVVRVVFVFEPAKGAAAAGGGGGGSESGSADAGGGEREAAFELLVPETGGYQVVFSTPRVDDKRLAACVGTLNQSRDLAAFLKQMRAFFVEMLG
jgi:kinetochore protein Spc25